MPAIKVTSWNIEWLDKLWPNKTQGTYKQRWDAIIAEIQEIGPDILCVIEGAKGRSRMRKFVQDLGAPYKLVELRNAAGNLASDSAYKIQGQQWVWFIVNQNMDPAPSRLELLQPDAWYSYTQGVSWTVNFWGDYDSSNHKHYRTPQVLIAEWPQPGSTRLRVDFVGLHLKSKHIRKSVSLADWATDPANNKKKAYITEALKARIKLATEALDVRRYIEARFEQEAEPAVVLMGDLNDGPGKEMFERQFLFFDLVSNLQGDVFFSTRFLNHALIRLRREPQVEFLLQG